MHFSFLPHDHQTVQRNHLFLLGHWLSLLTQTANFEETVPTFLVVLPVSHRPAYCRCIWRNEQKSIACVTVNVLNEKPYIADNRISQAFYDDDDQSLPIGL